MVTAIGKQNTLDMKSLAVQAQQLQDNAGAAVDMTDLTSLAGSTRYVAAGSTKTLTTANKNQTVLLDTAAGSTVTLPAATGTGDRFRFLVSVIATTNSHKVQVANATDVIQGIIMTISDDSGAPVKAYAGASTSDTITLNRSTTGSVAVGEWLDIEDVASGFFYVRGMTQSTGTEASPFSAAVS